MNIDKTKAMLIQKQKPHAKSKKNKHWKLGDKELKECVSYKYLCVTLKSNWSFSEHIEKLKEKAHKSYFPLYLKPKNGTVSRHVFFFYLFDNANAAILNYASEIWGLEEWSNLETLTKACKYALCVRSSATTDDVYAELGVVSFPF